MNQEIDYHSRYLKYKIKYLNLKSKLDGGHGIMHQRMGKQSKDVVKPKPYFDKVEPKIINEREPEELFKPFEVSWKNEPKFVPKFDDNTVKLKDMNCKNSELKIFLTENKEKRLKWCMDKKSLKLKDLESEEKRTEEHFIKFFYPWILKRIFPKSSKYKDFTNIPVNLMVLEYKKGKSVIPEKINLTIFYNEGIKAKWTTQKGETFVPKQHLSVGLFGKVKEGKIGDHNIDLQLFEKEHIQFLIDFQIKLNEVFEHWVKMIATQKDEDITAFLIKVKEMWNRTHRFFVSIKK